jgi:hypothetical protein
MELEYEWPCVTDWAREVRIVVPLPRDSIVAETIIKLIACSSKQVVTHNGLTEWLALRSLLNFRFQHYQSLQLTREHVN